MNFKNTLLETGIISFISYLSLDSWENPKPTFQSVIPCLLLYLPNSNITSSKRGLTLSTEGILSLEKPLLCIETRSFYQTEKQNDVVWQPRLGFRGVDFAEDIAKALPKELKWVKLKAIKAPRQTIPNLGPQIPSTL